MQRSSAVLCLGLGLIVLCSGQRAPVPAEPFDVRGTKHPEAAIVEVQQKPGLVPLDIEGIYGSLDVSCRPNYREDFRCPCNWSGVRP